jgi:hypothetical protein
MPQTCNKCFHTNPDEAFFCYLDGNVLHGLRAGPLNTGAQPFYSPFIFPSGRACRNFDELVLACQELWPEAQRLLKQGYLEGFLGSLGRADLAQAAGDAARAPDLERGLDGFLAKLPSQVLEPPRLYVTPQEINLGQLKVGQNHRLGLHLVNQGMGLLHGTVRCEDCIWLSFGDTPGVHDKIFQFRNDLILPVHVRGQQLRASNKPLRGFLVIDTNGGSIQVPVRAEVPVLPFPEGVLAGALSPRQIAEKARAAPKEAAPLFEKGTVSHWYEQNGWTYPVQGPAASGLGAVQQFFEALGLTSPPRVELSTVQVNFVGQAGQHLQQVIEVRSAEKRPVYAYATSDQPWLEVGRARFQGRVASIPLTIPSVPNRSGEVFHARLTVVANGNQQFAVPVTLTVRGTGVSRTAIPVAQPAPGWAVPANESPVALPTARLTGVPEPARPATPTRPAGPDTATEAPARPPTTAISSAASPDGRSTQVRPPNVAQPRVGCFTHLAPALLLLLLLGGVVVRDVFLKVGSGGEPAVEEEITLLDSQPRIGIRFQQRADSIFRSPTMRFGLVMLKEPDPDDPERLKRLTFDAQGRSNNTCLRIDGSDRLFGENRSDLFPETSGRWKGMNQPLEQNRPWPREGAKSTWVYNDVKLAITQTVEVVPGEPSRLLDTCRVRYRIENRDQAPHRVGLRFLLDTYIGANDGVPFLIPGSQSLCDTKHTFDSPAEVPDFIQALEHENLDSPGTVAQVHFRLGAGIEPPDRVTLGAWPDRRLAASYPEFRNELQQQYTGWDVPVLPMKTMRPADSAVVMYWDERPLAPGAVREVGFSYGLGALSSGEGHGKLALTVGGSFAPGGEFTVTAYVRSPQPGQKLTLTVPDGFEIMEGGAEQAVPPLPADATSRNSPVTWKVRAARRAGKYTLKVQSSTGETQSQPVTVRTPRLFD